MFERLDRNKDGYLSKEELAEHEAKNGNWIAVDRDRDGRISRAEFGLVARPAHATAASQPSAAAGGSSPKKRNSCSRGSVRLGWSHPSWEEAP